MPFKHFRQFALAALVVVAGSVSTYAGTVYEQILEYAPNINTDTKNITAVAGATNSFTHGIGTEISGSQQVSGLLYTGSYPNLSLPSTAYVTFDLRSTDDNTGIGVQLSQDFRGTYSISSGVNGTGTVYVHGDDILGNINTFVGENTLDLSATTNPAPDYDGNGNPVVATGGVLTGSLIYDPDTGDELYTNAFGIQLTLAHISGLSKTTKFGHSTVQFTSANLDAGSVSAFVPEPSTFSLLGLGVAGLALGAYRRRKAATAAA